MRSDRVFKFLSITSHLVVNTVGKTLMYLVKEPINIHF